MKIAYGVHGYGRGHATRALAVLPELTERHDVLVLAGGDAHAMLTGAGYDVVRIPHLRYYYGRPGKVSTYLTLKRNLSSVLDVKLAGHGVQMVVRVLEAFEPRVVMADSEAWSLRAARFLGLPRLMFDHYGVMVYARPPLGPWGRFRCRLESLAYKTLMGYPERMVTTAFFPAPPKRKGLKVVGPILRPVVRETEPTGGDHLLVYFSSGPLHFTPRVEKALAALDVPVVIYNKGREDTAGNLDFRLLDNTAFVKDLASARAVFATAGNQLIGEAIWFGKPVLALPEDSLEQHVNADTVERMGIGEKTSEREVTAARLRRFLKRTDAYAAAIGPHRRDGMPEAVEAIEGYIEELGAR